MEKVAEKYIAKEKDFGVYESLKGRLLFEYYPKWNPWSDLQKLSETYAT